MNEHLARKIVAERADGICERCRGARQSNCHHRKPQSQGGLWTPSNLLALCGSGTTGCHGEVESRRTVSYEQGWLVRRNHIPADVPVWMFGWGFVLLDDSGQIIRLDDDDVY